jgi:hypothetical protein
LCLWHTAGCRRNRTVKVNLSCLDLPMARMTARKALHALESADLVHVERQPGRCYQVTLLDAPDSND